MIGCDKCGHVLISGNHVEGEVVAARALGWGIVDEKYVCRNCMFKLERTDKMEKSTDIKIGETLQHGGQKFVIVDIKHHATMDGVMLIMTAYDPNMADKEQQKQIKMDQTSQNMIEMLKKLTEGGGLDFGGFKLGGS